MNKNELNYVNCQVTTLGEDGNDDDDSGSDSGEELGDLMEDLSAEVNWTEVVSSEAGDDEDEEDPIELVHVDEDFFYMAHVMRIMALLHSLVSLAMLIAYYHLKVRYFVSNSTGMPAFFIKYFSYLIIKFHFSLVYIFHSLLELSIASAVSSASYHGNKEHMFLLM